MRGMRRVAVRLVSAGRVRADIVGSEASVRASVEPGDFQDWNLFNFFHSAVFIFFFYSTDETSSPLNTYL